MFTSVCTRFLGCTMLIVLLGLLPSQSQGQLKQLDRVRLNEEGRFVLSLVPHIKYSGLVRLLPRNTRVNSPSWSESDQAVGNVIRLSGSIQGFVVCVSREQNLLMDQDKELTDEQKRFSPEDNVVFVMLETPLEKNKIHPENYWSDKVKLMGAALDHASQVRTKEESSDIIPAGLKGGAVSFSTKNRLKVDFWENWYGKHDVLCVYPDLDTGSIRSDK